MSGSILPTKRPRIGYLIGQFPGPSHTYFWREITQLRQRGLQVELCSTRLPTSELAPHSWAKAAVDQTTYLVPLTLMDIVRCLAIILGAGPVGWYKCLQSICRAQDVSLKERFRLLAYVFFGARLVQVARRRQWRHVHVGFCLDSANVAIFARMLGNLPYSLSLHGSLDAFGPNQHQKWGNAAFGTAITEKLRQELVDALGTSLPEILEIAPMGVDLELYQRQTDYIPWSGRGPLRIFCCARIAPIKGYPELLEAFARVRQAGIDARLTIAGEPFPRLDWYMDLLDKTIDEHGIRPYVEFLGPVPEERVREELDRTHIFCLASYCEGLGVAIMEAAAMGVPVISTNAGGVPELIESGHDGLLVEPRSAPALADAILKLAYDPALALSFSRVCRGRIERDFHSGRSAEVMLRCLYRTSLRDCQAITSEVRLESAAETVAPRS